MSFKGEYIYFSNPHGKIEMWSAYQFELVKNIQALEDTSLEIRDFDVSFSEGMIVIYYDDDSIVVYDNDKNCLVSRFKAMAELSKIKVSPDEQKIIGVIQGGQLTVQDP